MFPGVRIEIRMKTNILRFDVFKLKYDKDNWHLAQNDEKFMDAWMRFKGFIPDTLIITNIRKDQYQKMAYYYFNCTLFRKSKKSCPNLNPLKKEPTLEDFLTGGGSYIHFYKEDLLALYKRIN